MTESPIRGMILAAFGFSLYSIGDTFMKLMTAELTVIQTAFWISVMSMIGFISLSPELGGLKQTFQSKNKHLHLAKGVLGVMVFLMMINGFQKLGLALSYTLIFAGPFIAALLSVVLLKHKIGMHRWISILMGFLGVVIVLRPGAVPIEWAAIGILFAAFCFAMSSIITRKIGSDEPTLSFAFYGTLVSLGCLTVMMFATGGFETLPTIAQITFFISVSFFHIGGTFAVTRAFKSYDTAIIAPFHYVQLLWGMFFGYVLFEDTIDIWTGVGEDMMLGNKKIDQVDSFIYLGSTISKDGGCSENFESRIVNSQGFFHNKKCSEE